MSKQTLTNQGAPTKVNRTLAKLGLSVQEARRRKRLSLNGLARQMFCDPRTIKRMERGDPAVGLGIFLSALHCLGLLKYVNEMAAKLNTDAQKTLPDELDT